MKTFLLACLITFSTGCTIQKQVQVRIVDVQLIKMEPVHRSLSIDEMLLTWKDDDNIEYVSFESIKTPMSIGSRMKMMIRK